jgi:predicted DNA-binding protein (UPF0278 family)
MNTQPKILIVMYLPMPTVYKTVENFMKECCSGASFQRLSERNILRWPCVYMSFRAVLMRLSFPHLKRIN